MRSLSPAWAGVLDRYEAEVPADSAAAVARLMRVKRFAEDHGGNPWTVDSDAVRVWAEGLPGNAETVKKNRQSVRSFYRWAAAAELIPASPLEALPRYTDDVRWLDALDMFAQHQRSAGIAEATLDRRMSHLRRFARWAGAGPWVVSHEDCSAWITSGDAAQLTRETMRDSLRSFYRWAHSRGRVDVDPTAEPDRRLAARRSVPAQWEEPVRAWRSWLRASGRPETTIGLRMHQVGRFARDHASLSPWDVSLDDLIEWMAAKRWSNETRRSQRSALRSFYLWAVDSGRMDADPSANLPTVRVGRGTPRPALEPEYERALRAADADDRLALRLAAELGMRCAEVACVHSRDLFESADDGWFLVVHGKGSKERTLPVPESLANLMRSFEGYIFPGQHDGHVSPKWLSTRVSRLLPVGVTMHALRHRFATIAYNIDRDVFTVQQLLGHASPATTQGYVLVDSQTKRALVSAVQRAGGGGKR